MRRGKASLATSNLYRNAPAAVTCFDRTLLRRRKPRRKTRHGRAAPPRLRLFRTPRKRRRWDFARLACTRTLPARRSPAGRALFPQAPRCGRVAGRLPLVKRGTRDVQVGRAPAPARRLARTTVQRGGGEGRAPRRR
eukprot:359967-Chlamydomonas_euryale.AAC.2